MPVFTRPDAEIYYEVHGSGFPLPTHLAESIRRVGEFLNRNTPTAWSAA